MSNGTGWKEALTCFSPNFITHKVGDQDLNFYAVSLGMAFKLKVVGKPMARSLAVLFGNKDNDHGTADRSIANEHGGEDREILIEPISEGMAKIRHEQRVEAIDKLVEALTSDTNISLIGEIIMDSLKEVFDPAKKGDWPPASEFINSMPLPIVGEMVMGVIESNKRVFGPLTEQVAAAARAAVKRVGAANTDPDTSPAPDSVEEPPVIAGTVSPATSG